MGDDCGHIEVAKCEVIGKTVNTDDCTVTLTVRIVELFIILARLLILLGNVYEHGNGNLYGTDRLYSKTVYEDEEE